MNIRDVELYADTVCANCDNSLDYRGQIFCEECRDNSPVESGAIDYRETGYSDAGSILGPDPIETDSLSECLQDIARGLGDSLTFTR